MRVLAPFFCVALLLCLSIKPVLAVETDDDSDLQQELARTTMKFTQVIDVKEGSAPKPAPIPASNSTHPPSLGSVQWNLDKRGGGTLWHGQMAFGEGSMYRVMPDTGSSLTVRVCGSDSADCRAAHPLLPLSNAGRQSCLVYSLCQGARHGQALQR